MKGKQYNFVMPDFFNLPNIEPTFLDNTYLKNKDNSSSVDLFINEKTNICAICYEKIKEKCIVEGCSHQFCKNCIFTWLKTRKNCPLCRAKINNIIEDDKIPIIFDKRNTLKIILNKNKSKRLK